MIIGHGVDVVDLERFGRALSRTPSMGRRLFTPEELTDAERAGDPVASLAARFAAREATMKAMGVGLGAFRFHDVAVHRPVGEAPSLRITGRAETLAAERGIDRWVLSLSHSRLVAMASVIAERTDA